jgi:hypothetical protein
MPTHQYSLDLISHQVDQSVIQQRARDGYINASQLCKVARKHWHQYVMPEPTNDFIRALMKSLGVSRDSLIESLNGEVWVHPQLAIHLGQWLSVDFQVKVTDWVHKWMSGPAKPQRAELPYHLKRHMLNFGKVPPTHFSILQQMTTSLIAPLEHTGYTLPDSMLPDISQGRMFCKFARDVLKLNTDQFPTYDHEFEDGRVVQAKLYPVEYLGEFCKYINDVWMPQRAQAYFKERDPKALPFLDRVLQISYQPPKASSERKLTWVRPRKKPAPMPMLPAPLQRTGRPAQ